MRTVISPGLRALVGALGIALAVTAVSGCSGGRKTATPSPLPPASASSQDVVRSYLDAAKSGDCAVTQELTAASTWAWCDTPKLTGYKNLGEVTKLPASQAGVDLDCYHLTITTTAEPKRGITAGTRPWTLCFEHTGEGYRLYQQGMG